MKNTDKDKNPNSHHFSMSSSRSSIKLLQWSKTVRQIPACALSFLYDPPVPDIYMGGLLNIIREPFINKPMEMIPLNINIADIFSWSNISFIDINFQGVIYFILCGRNETLCWLKFCIVGSHPSITRGNLAPRYCGDTHLSHS